MISPPLFVLAVFCGRSGGFLELLSLRRSGGLGPVVADQIPRLNLTPGQRQPENDKRGDDPGNDQDTREGHGFLLSTMEDEVVW